MKAFTFVILSWLHTFPAIDPNLPPNRAGPKMVASALSRAGNDELADTPQRISTAWLQPAEHESRTGQSKVQHCRQKAWFSRRGRSRLFPHRLWRCPGKPFPSAFRTPGAPPRTQKSGSTNQTYLLKLTSLMRCGLRSPSCLALQRSTNYFTALLFCCRVC